MWCPLWDSSFVILFPCAFTQIVTCHSMWKLKGMLQPLVSQGGLNRPDVKVGRSSLKRNVVWRHDTIYYNGPRGSERRKSTLTRDGLDEINYNRAMVKRKQKVSRSDACGRDSPSLSLVHDHHHMTLLIAQGSCYCLQARSWIYLWLASRS